jgi:hypothetical protein
MLLLTKLKVLLPAQQGGLLRVSKLTLVTPTITPYRTCLSEYFLPCFRTFNLSIMHICLLLLVRLCEACFGTICSCMPAITASLKPFASRVTSYWISIKKYSNTILSPTNHSSTINSKEQLPDIPHGTLSGLRTFINRFHATRGQTVLVSDSSTAIQEDTILDYHDQLRDIHHRDYERQGPGISQHHLKETSLERL